MKTVNHLDLQMRAERLRPPNRSAHSLLKSFGSLQLIFLAFPQIPIFSTHFPPENLYPISKLLYRRPEDLAKPPISVIIQENSCSEIYVPTESICIEIKNPISHHSLADHENQPKVAKLDADDEDCAVCLEKDADAVPSPHKLEFTQIGDTRQITLM